MRGEELFITGRLKDLLIIRGLNHYPQDIELTAERSHTALRPGCGAAFSIEASGEERLVLVQEVDRHEGELSEVIEQIRQEVAEEHELTAHAVALIKPGTIPKTSSGKIQRGAARAAFLDASLEVLALWRASDTGAAADASVADAPATARVEEWLTAQAAKSLGMEAATIDVKQPLTRYGLDSLAAIELAHAIESALGLVVSPADLLESASIDDLAARFTLRGRELQATETHAPHAPEEETAHEHLLSRGQESLWFMYRIAPESPAYNIMGALRVRFELDAGTLKRAFQRLVDRHPTLRTTYVAHRGAPVQRVASHAEVCFEEEDASDWSEEDLRARLNAESHRPFDLERGPLMRVSLYARTRQAEHVLLVVVHHIAADFWSLAVLMHELGVFYEAERRGDAATLPPLPLQYTDYVKWQERLLAGPEGERLASFWREQLAGELPVLNLPTDRPRPPVQTFRGASESFKLDAELTAALKSLGQSSDATLNTVLLAAFQTLLHRYTGQTEILVGTPTAGRNRAELGGLVGYFVNPVAVRTDFSGSPSFELLLARARRTLLDAFAHADYAFATLVERLQPERDPGRSPIFQAMFVLQKTHLHEEAGIASFALGEAGARLTLGSLELESFSLEQRIAQFDLTLMMAEAGGGLIGSLQYNADLFEPATVRRFAAAFRALLAAATQAPGTPVAHLPLFDEAERRRLLDSTSGPRLVHAPTCLHELFTQQAARTPERTALSHRGERLSYRELDERSSRLAAELRRVGVGPEALVAVLAGRTPRTVVSLLAILKTGAAYVPLDPNYPPARLAFMLEDTRAPVVLTERALASSLPPTSAHIILLDEWEQSAASSEERDDLPASVTPDHLAYVIYTSGSTGTPKGVAITHRSASALLDWAHSTYSEAELAGVLAATSLCFDLSIFELFAPLSCGGCVLLADSALELAGAGEWNEVTLINTVPSAMTELLRLRAVPRSVVTVNLAGEPLTATLARRVYAECSGVKRLYNLYGPTEDTTYSTGVLVGRGAESISIGRALAGGRAVVLDAWMEIVPEGVAGELYLGGEGLARGYLGRAEMTAERFVPDPYAGEVGARLYRTGDVARVVGGGELEFLGRVDHQVKLRGYRIELGEVQAALNAHPSVRESLVMVRTSAADAAAGNGHGANVEGDQRLVAYVVGEAGAEGEAAGARELRDFLKQRLPDYMLPSAFVRLSEWPLTPNGKIDRKALPAPSGERAEQSGVQWREARTPTEEVVAGIWGEVLRVERVGAEENFFELGGHSLLATQVVARCEEAFGVALELRRLFESPTVAALAALIDESEKGRRAPSVKTLPRGGQSFQELLARLDELSEDEVRRLLGEQPSAVGGARDE
ncbi:MAG: amino acid adenylation domain-containing protein, partial [Pyrinomonadaceae bacterium]